jgi:hypothetical protein
MVNVYNPSTREAEAGEYLLRGQPGIHSETCFPKKEINTNQNNRKQYTTIENNTPFRI